MSGYTPLFNSLTEGTLCGKWPDIGLWPIVLSMCDRHGNVDKHPTFIARVTGLPVEEVMACMDRFCQPDPHSRTADSNGARLVLLDPETRSWGWRVVNHGRYREKARKASFDAARVADGRNAARMGTRRDPTRPARTRAHPPSNSNSNSNKKGTPLPADLVLDDRMRAFAEQRGLADPALVFEKFKAWHETKGTLSKSWPASWRTWVLKQLEFAADKAGPHRRVDRRPD